MSDDASAKTNTVVSRPIPRAQARRAERHQRAHAHQRDGDTGHAAEHREQQTFREHLPDEARSRGAKAARKPPRRYTARANSRFVTFTHAITSTTHRDEADEECWLDLVSLRPAATS
jgi:hypothetical protein